MIPLSGRWFVETTDGHLVEMGSGEASFGGDQHGRPDAHASRGLLCGTLGDAPLTLMFAGGPLPDPAAGHCRFR